MTTFFRRVWHLLRKDQDEADLAEELEFHRTMKEQELLQRGLSPEYAAQHARKALGSVALAKDRARDVWIWPWLQDVLLDVRFATRLLRHHVGVSLVAVLTLATGLGAATSVFGLREALLARPPAAVQDAARVVSLYGDDPETPEPDYFGFSYPQFVELRAEQRAVEAVQDVASYVRIDGPFRIDGHSRFANLEFASGNYFSLLGVTPARGRIFSDADDRPNGPVVAVVSHRFWQAELGGDPEAIGRRIMVGEVPTEIIGVAPVGFVGHPLDWYPNPEIWLPLHAYTTILQTDRLERSVPGFALLARLNAGDNLRAAEQHVSTLVSHLTAPRWPFANITAVTLLPMSETRVHPARRASIERLSTMLLGVASLILLIGCFNVATFLLGQAAARQQELGVRAALGASRRRVVGQLVVEASLLAALAAAGGLAVTLALSRALATLPDLYGRVTLDVGSLLSPGVFGFATGLAALTTLLFGLLPAVIASRQSLRASLATARQGTSALGGIRTQRGLLVALQVAFAVALVGMGGLCLQSLRSMITVDLGHPADRLLAARLTARGAMSDAVANNFWRDLLLRLRERGEVVSAAFSSMEPYLQGRMPYEVVGEDPATAHQAGWTQVSPGYFTVLQAPLAAGRDFTEADQTERATVIINEVMANLLWPDGGAVGRHLRLPRLPCEGCSSGGPDRVIVGVVRLERCADALDVPHPCMWGPALPDSDGTVLAHTRVAPAQIAELVGAFVREANPNVSAVWVRSLDEILYDRLATPRLTAIATGTVAIIGMLLAAVGCFALFASAVKQGTREIAIRMALGARASWLYRRCLLQAAGMASAGIVVGLIVTAWIRHAIADQLHGDSLRDPGPFIAAAAILLAVALGASFWPARTATRTDVAALLKGD